MDRVPGFFGGGAAETPRQRLHQVLRKFTLSDFTLSDFTLSDFILSDSSLSVFTLSDFTLSATAVFFYMD